jgi:aldehyde dehydrogenase (NAD+)
MSRVQSILNTMEYGPAPEADDGVKAWLASHSAGFCHFIGGQFVQPAEGELFAVGNPANGEELARVAQGGAKDVDDAVAAARAAFKSWSVLPGHVRCKHLYALARLLQKRARFFAVLETMDNGKPIRESRDIDIPLVIRHFYHHAGWAELVESELPGYQPLGVCGQIIPWNFPLLMLAWKVAPALAAGNTVVLKPAELTPLTAIAFAELCVEAGLPPGVVNIVTGDGRTGELITNHPDIDKIAFTGSTEVGRIIRRAIAGSGKKLSLELGGKSPFIVFDDADLDSAVEGVVDAIWFNQGQVCCAGSRLLVQEGVADRLHAKLRRRLETLRVGDPMDKSTDIGPVIDKTQLDRITSLVASGCAQGLDCWQPSTPLPADGFYFQPTILANIAPSSPLAQEEIFGPVLVSMTFRTPEEALLLANNSRYGLSASIWSENINVALEAAAQVQAGVVWINATNLFDAAAGFGGYRESGFGREGGREGLYEYLAEPAQPLVEAKLRADRPDFSTAPNAVPVRPGNEVLHFDRTAKLYIGGKQTRPDSGYSYTIRNPQGDAVGQAGLGNRKDVRNAVEAAHKASGWSRMSGHARAQVLYYLAENLDIRAAEFGERLRLTSGISKKAAEEEVEASIRRISFYAAHADKFDGRVHSTIARHVTLAMNEPWGVMGCVAPETYPLLGLVSLVIPAIAMGNRIIVVPSAINPLPATDFYQVLDTSDVPAGVVNMVTGDPAALGKTLVEHDDVAALWHFAPEAEQGTMERASSGNLKVTWMCQEGNELDWLSPKAGQGQPFLRRATQIKNVWIPYGE